MSSCHNCEPSTVVLTGLELMLQSDADFQACEKFRAYVSSGDRVSKRQIVRGSGERYHILLVSIWVFNPMYGL